MNRRLFIGQAVAALALQSTPFALTAKPLFLWPINSASASHQRSDQVAKIVRSGLIGTVEQISIVQTYSPAQTTVATIKGLAQRTFERAWELTNKGVTANQLVFADSSSAAFGSYTGSFVECGVAVTWQVLARIGGEPRPATGQLQVYGSAGVLQLSDQQPGYQILDLDGHLRHSVSNQSSIL